MPLAVRRSCLEIRDIFAIMTNDRWAQRGEDGLIPLRASFKNPRHRLAGRAEVDAGEDLIPRAFRPASVSPAMATTGELCESRWPSPGGFANGSPEKNLTISATEL
jgi:hypothetical protein